MAYYGAASVESRSVAANEDLIISRDGCSTHCTGEYTNGADITAAQNGLRNHFASYPSWSKSIVYV
jgi:hypothetical protein